ncbi:hypothetical protein BOTBODRAFT_553738 [Botryobasidium botryosum FD-172 SS1]|uniref:Uncharacterized protein n=1 Tax=Botryobasidium botryosum (strain FD-172 SS1) TaxID=930990 RepID=A0A067MU37_BOTB1|nr:hypothetical protein BOTBODRAFT_553738 [Botryobasidium botryosum FD-172 SS1]
MSTSEQSLHRRTSSRSTTSSRPSAPPSRSNSFLKLFRTQSDNNSLDRKWVDVSDEPFCDEPGPMGPRSPIDSGDEDDISIHGRPRPRRKGTMNRLKAIAKEMQREKSDGYNPSDSSSERHRLARQTSTSPPHSPPPVPPKDHSRSPSTMSVASTSTTGTKSKPTATRSQSGGFGPAMLAKRIQAMLSTVPASPTLASQPLPDTPPKDGSPPPLPPVAGVDDANLRKLLASTSIMNGSREGKKKKDSKGEKVSFPAAPGEPIRTVGTGPRRPKAERTKRPPTVFNMLDTLFPTPKKDDEGGAGGGQAMGTVMLTAPLHITKESRVEFARSRVVSMIVPDSDSDSEDSADEGTSSQAGGKSGSDEKKEKQGGRGEGGEEGGDR